MEKPRHKLRAARIARGLSQEALAEEIEVTRGSISDWECGKIVPYPYHVGRLCHFFGVPDPAELDLVCTIQSTPSTHTSSQPSKTLASFSHTVPQDITGAIHESERGGMNKDRRVFLAMLGTSLVLSHFNGDFHSFIAETLSSDHITLLEKEMAARWGVYHKGETIQAHNGLHLWLEEIERWVREVNNPRARTLISMSYQLQGSILRDKMDYAQAHQSYKRAFLAADEFDNDELKSSSFARRGVTSIQQQKPLEAIEYLECALAIIKDLDFPCLKGYIFQALSEAHAMAHHKDQSLENINLAESVLEGRNRVVEQSNCQLNTTSVTAQRGVNAVLLGEHATAVDILDVGLSQYNPSLLRGRARLIAQKADAYYGSGFINESVVAAKEAFMMAYSIGSQKTMARVKNLHTALQQSRYRKENSVVQLEAILSTNS